MKWGGGARSPNLARAREDARVSHLLGGIDEVGVLHGGGLRGEHRGENDLLRESLEDVEVDDFVLARFLREHGLEEEGIRVSVDDVGVRASQIALRARDDAVRTVDVETVGGVAASASVRTRDFTCLLYTSPSPRDS